MSTDSSDPSLLPVELPPAAPLDLPPARKPGRPLRRATTNRPAPRFGTAHLLLWLGYTCAYLATNRELYEGPLSPERMLLLIGQVLPRGAAWAGLAMLVRRWCRKGDAPIEPGEWLMAIAGAWLLADTALRSGLLSQHFQTPEMLLTALACLLLVAPTLTAGLSTRWRWYFSFLAVVFAWPLMVDLLAEPPIGQSTWISRSAELLAAARFYLAALVLMLVAGRDRLSGVRHGWLHWVGLVDVLLVLLSGAAAKVLLGN